jgi:hypothetical protein
MASKEEINAVLIRYKEKAAMLLFKATKVTPSRRSFFCIRKSAHPE